MALKIHRPAVQLFKRVNPNDPSKFLYFLQVVVKNENGYSFVRNPRTEVKTNEYHPDSKRYPNKDTTVVYLSFERDGKPKTRDYEPWDSSEFFVAEKGFFDNDGDNRIYVRSLHAEKGGGGAQNHGGSSTVHYPDADDEED